MPREEIEQRIFLGKQRDEYNAQKAQEEAAKQLAAEKGTPSGEGWERLHRGRLVGKWVSGASSDQENKRRAAAARNQEGRGWGELYSGPPKRN